MDFRLYVRKYLYKIPKIPLPIIKELYDRMAGCTVYTVIDLASVYRRKVVNQHSCQYKAFRNHKETYKLPGVWSRIMRVLFDKDDFVVVSLDDICVFY